MTTVSSTFAAVGVSSSLFVRKGKTLTISVTDTFVATLQLQIERGSNAWETIREFNTTLSTSFTAPEDRRYRLRCHAYTSGTVTYEFSDSAGVIESWENGDGATLLSITEEAVEIPTAAIDTADIADATVSGGVLFTGASAAGETIATIGGAAAEGLNFKVIEETVDLTAAGAKYVAMTTPIPAGAVILSVQANIEVLVVAGGTTVKVALGPNGGDVDKYGITSDLTLNQKISTIPDWAVLASETAIDVCGVVTDGSALGDTNLSAGSVRVRIVYLELAALADA